MIGQLIATFGLDTAPFERSYRKLDRRFVAMQRSIFSLQGAFVGLGGAAAVRGLVRTAVELDRVNNTLKFATGSSEEAAQAMGFLRKEADRLGQDVLRSAEVFAQLSAAAKGTALSGAQVKEIFLGISEASTVLGLSADQARGALRSIEQMISKGNVQAEELRGQLGERLPGAFQIAARAMGVTTEKLNDMLEAGEVQASDMLPKLAKELRKTFGPDVAASANSTQAQINRLNNELLDLQKTLIDSGLVDGIMGFARGLAFVGEKFVEVGKASGIAVAQMKTFIDGGDTFHEKLLRLFISPLENLRSILVGTFGDLPSPTAAIDKQIESLREELDELENGGNSRSRFWGEEGKQRHARIEAIKEEIAAKEKLRETMRREAEALSVPKPKPKPAVTSVAEIEKIPRLFEASGLAAIVAEGRTKSFFDELEEGARLTESVMTAQEKYTAAVEHYDALLARNKISQETYNRLLADAKDRLEDSAQGFDFMKAAAEGAAQSIQSTLADFFMNFDDGVKGMVKGFVDALHRMTAEMLAFQTLKAAFEGTPLGSFFGFAPGKAMGGPVSAGKPYTVGENGRELFVPNQSGVIVPENKLTGSAPSLTVHVHAQGAVSPVEVARMSREAVTEGLKRYDAYRLRGVA